MMEVPRSDSFSRLPVEIILHCFCSLSSFWDALRFAATCQQNRWIWTANVSIIYQHISPKAIQCRRYARTLLADQGGAPADSHVLTTHDVLQLVRNTVVMKKSIEQFNKVYVYRFTTGPNKPNKASWPYFGNKPRPPYLIKTERARFVRGLYQLWSIVILEPKARQQRMESLCLKDLATLLDLTQYDEIMIYDKTVIAMQEVHRGLLETRYGELWGPYLRKLHELLGDPPDSFRREPPYGMGYLGRIAIWNDNVEDLKEVVTMKMSPSVPDPDFSELWYDTPDEDLSD